ncbi:MAG: glycoside hydrolase family 43 protein [Oscillospiraceae bacterium]
MIKNPILKGFNPDPSIIRVGDDFYIATSTFEWFPGVCIYHSKDLKNWELHSTPLNRISQLDMLGVPNGGGIWAPCLTYDNGTFYLVYTNVKERGMFFQTDNYLVTTDDINSKWSEPIYLNSDGFDPSLFHDDDGKKWLINLDNHYKEGQRFNGLTLTEYDPKKQEIIGLPKKIYENPDTELVEGSHIYKRNGYYYLLKAQGGTGSNHSVQMSRSRSLFGKYEDCPFIVLTSRDDPKNPLQCAGHADIVETQHGEWYMVHLSTEHMKNSDTSTMGRETCIQKVKWNDDGWLELSDGGHNPYSSVASPLLPEHKFKSDVLCLFSEGKIPKKFFSLRVPLSEKQLSLTARKGYMRLTGTNGLTSKFQQSLIAQKLSDFAGSISTELEFEPDFEKHMAGLVCIYDTSYWYYLYITRNTKTKAKELDLIKMNHEKCEFVLENPIPLDENVPIILKADIDNEIVNFSFSYDNEFFAKVGTTQDMKILTDENVFLGFKGTMVGICCQDLHKKDKYADFKWFKYEKKEI